MADVINLRQARKARKRAEAQQTAQANRAKHGRTKAEKIAAEAEVIRREAVLNGTRRDPAED